MITITPVCRRIAASLESSDIVDIMNAAATIVARTPGASDEKSCSTFFHAIGANLRKRGLPANTAEWTTQLANDIVKTLAEDREN